MQAPIAQGLISPRKEHPGKSVLIQSSRRGPVRSGGVSQPGSAQHRGQPLHPRVSVYGSCRSRKGTRLQLCCVVWTTHFSFLSLIFHRLTIAEKTVDSAPLTFPDGGGEGRQMRVCVCGGGHLSNEQHSVKVLAVLTYVFQVQAKFSFECRAHLCVLWGFFFGTCP